MWRRKVLFMPQKGETHGQKRCMYPEGAAPHLGSPILGNIFKVVLIYIHTTDLKVLLCLKMLETVQVVRDNFTGDQKDANEILPRFSLSGFLPSESFCSFRPVLETGMSELPSLYISWITDRKHRDLHTKSDSVSCWHSRVSCIPVSGSLCPLVTLSSSFELDEWAW